MLLAGGFEAHFTLPVEPGVPVPGVHLQDRLEFAAATIDAAFHEGHGTSTYHDAGTTVRTTCFRIRCANIVHPHILHTIMEGASFVCQTERGRPCRSHSSLPKTA